MMLTLFELKQKLAERFDPDGLLDLLNPSSEQVVEAFTDMIDERMDELIAELQDEHDEEHE